MDETPPLGILGLPPTQFSNPANSIENASAVEFYPFIAFIITHSAPSAEPRIGHKLIDFNEEFSVTGCFEGYQAHGVEKAEFQSHFTLIRIFSIKNSTNRFSIRCLRAKRSWTAPLSSSQSPIVPVAPQYHQQMI